MSQFSLVSESLHTTLHKTFTRLEELRFAPALQARDAAMWTTDEATRTRIVNRLGWVDAIHFSRGELSRVQAFANSIKSDAFPHVVLLGMGGSSLGPEVLRQVIGVAPGFPRFHMLDSVDPEAVRQALSAADRSLFIFASKSGGTIEPNAMAAEARRRVQAAGVTDWGSRFVAITDEGTSLHRLAQTERFREIFVNPSNIGGRYSALSLFGMVPAAVMGIDVAALLDRADDMRDRCFVPDVKANPGLALGAFMAAGALDGRDKLTLLLPPRLASFGLWVEQLVAESTGKEGKGVTPIAGEPTDSPVTSDRIAVAVHLPGERSNEARRSALLAANTPVMDIEMTDVLSLGAEFFRWEVATAAAGRLLDINPFDEPNVQQAKDATRTLLQTYASHKRLPFPEPHAAAAGVRLTASAAAQARLDGAPVTQFLRATQSGEYVALLAYLPPDQTEIDQVLNEARGRLARRTGVTTMFGYGPRYLHSTGQLHKGGPNNGMFIVVLAPPAEDLAIPGEPFSFGILEQAQALGDFLSLDQSGRRALLVQLPSRDTEALRQALQRLL